MLDETELSDREFLLDLAERMRETPVMDTEDPIAARNMVCDSITRLDDAARLEEIAKTACDGIAPACEPEPDVVRTGLGATTADLEKVSELRKKS